MDTHARKELVRSVVASVEYPPDRFEADIKAWLEVVHNNVASDIEIDFAVEDVFEANKNYFERFLKYVPLKTPERKALESALRPTWMRLPRQSNYTQYLYLEDKTDKLKAILERALVSYRDDFDKLSERSFSRKVGPFTVHNSGGYPEKVVEKIVSLIESALPHLTKHGFQSVCYGDINIVGNIHRTGSAAWYYPNTDTLSIRADLKENRESMSSVLHELGHRFWHKSGKVNHDYFVDLYKQQVEVQKNAEPKNGKIYPLGTIDVEYHGRASSTAHIVTIIPRPSGEMHTKAITEQQLKDVIEVAKGAMRFITSYASTDHKENFAEMFAFYCLDKMNTDRVPIFLQGIR